MNILDITKINKQFNTGTLVNASSLEFALSAIKIRDSWLEQLAYLIRALLVDHPFKDGNKRTATALVLAYFNENNIQYNKDKTIQTMIRISAKSPTKIKQIEKELKNLRPRYEITAIATPSSREEIVGTITTTKNSLGRSFALLARHVYRNSHPPDSAMGRANDNLGQDPAFCRLSAAVVPVMVRGQPGQEGSLAQTRGVVDTVRGSVVWSC